MTNLQNYIEENKEYISLDSLEVLASINDEQFEALIAATEWLGKSDPGLGSQLTKTHETLSDFENTRSTKWHEKGQIDFAEESGAKIVYFTDFQTQKGKERKSMAAVQFEGFSIAVV